MAKSRIEVNSMIEYLEKLGLLKMDFLAIKYLTTIHNIIDSINKDYNTNIKFDEINFICNNYNIDRADCIDMIDYYKDTNNPIFFDRGMIACIWDDKEEMATCISCIQTVREIKVNYGMKPSEDLEISLSINVSDDTKAILKKMCHAIVIDSIDSSDVLSRQIEGAVINVAMDKLIDLEEEKAKLEKEIKRLESEIKRASGMLSNPRFVEKAPAAKVNAEKEKLADFQNKLEVAKTQLADIVSKL